MKHVQVNVVEINCKRTLF